MIYVFIQKRNARPVYSEKPILLKIKMSKLGADIFI